MDLSISPSGLIFSCCLPICPIFTFYPSRFYFLCLSWHPLKSPKNPRFQTGFFIWLCVISDNYLTSLSLSFPLCIMRRDRITRRPRDLLQPRWYSHTELGKAFLCKAARSPPLPPPCYLANIKTQLRYLRAVLPYFCTHTTHNILVCPFFMRPLSRERSQKWKDKEDRLGFGFVSWPLTSPGALIAYL